MFSQQEAENWELQNGTLIAQSDLVNSKRYVLFIGHFGLRLLYTAELSSADLYDLTNCMWLTPIHEQWWYN